MKVLVCCVISACIAVGCSSQKTETAPQTVQTTANSENDEQLYTDAARNLTSQFSTKLQGTLLDALNESGVAYAVELCQTMAPQIASVHSVAGWKVKRVSEKWRTITGRPDSSELQILAKFADPATKENSLTAWSGPDSARVFHYYEKIQVRDVCLKCHGDLQTVDLDLWKQIRILYPWDKATGYRVGDLRGMFVVDAPYPGGRDVAQLLAQGVSVSQIAAATPRTESTH